MTTLRSPFSAGFTASAAEDLAATLQVLASPHRLKILAMLNASGPMTGIEIELCLGGLKQPTLSHHLRVLDRAGFITSATRGVYITRTLVPGRMRAVSLLLDPRPGGAA